MIFLADCAQESAVSDWAVASIFIVLILAILIGAVLMSRKD